ncbi:hypothetical protein OHV05_37430 (plasmid) [Kitasatospora sp. NBC_00070]|uniref:hypothetical protein n=1 Tax=Kitasatospora sp. NBC_00070 TaxID=2975962 RepID=UPI00325604BD
MKMAAALLTAGLALGAVAVPATSAGAATAMGTPTESIVRSSGIKLMNLVETTVEGKVGPIPALALASKPRLLRQPAGSAFFVYDPGLARVVPIWLSGDTAATSVADWKDVKFSALKPGQQLLEVRYGSPENPRRATVVASASRTDHRGGF